MVEKTNSASGMSNTRLRGVGSAELRADLEIDFNAPLDVLHISENPVFSVNDTKNQQKLMGVLAPPSSLPRLNYIENIKALQNPHILKLIDTGIVENPNDRQHYQAFVYEEPPAKPVLKNWEDEITEIPDHVLLNDFIPAALGALKQMYMAGVVHGAINLRNIYLAQNGDALITVIGECLSKPPSSMQHILFEPVERAMADPVGRGAGTANDDLYAFGMCVALLAGGKNPIASMTDDQIIYEKLATGSYSMIIGRQRLPASITELLRGVLNDEPSERWSFDDVEKWVEGRRLSPRQPLSQLKAARPFPFRDKKFWYLRYFVYHAAKHYEEAAKVFSGSKFMNWFTRNFDDKNLTANVEAIIKRHGSASSGGQSAERLASEMCMALDPQGPIRYKGVSVNVRGFGDALAQSYALNEDVQVYAEILNHQLYTTWFSMQSTLPSDAPTVAASFDRCRQFLNQKMTGYGLERVVYLRCENAPCLSPAVSRYFIADGAQLLIALEGMAASGQVKLPIFDRHMVAFLSVRHAKVIEPHLGLVNATNKTFQLLGSLKTLAAIQKIFKIGPVPHIADFMIQNSALITERLFDNRLKKDLQGRVNKHKGSGDLSAVLDVLDNENIIAEDEQRFIKAQQEFQAIGIMRRNLETALKENKDFGRARGRQIATILAATAATLGLLINILSFAASL